MAKIPISSKNRILSRLSAADKALLQHHPDPSAGSGSAQ
jgi:hypothetical protein